MNRNSAGLYVCNSTYYEALRLCNERPGMKALFVHLPLYEGQLSAVEGQLSMPLDDMASAIETIIHKIIYTDAKIQETTCAHI